MSSTGCSFRYTYQITQWSNEVNIVSRISEFLQITTKVNLLAEASYIIHIYNSICSHDGFLFPIPSEI